MKIINYIVILIALSLGMRCSGSKKYFKAAERLEKQGLVNDAANYYLESLQRKPTFVDARIKLKEIGQKHISSLASDFFRNINTNQLEASLSSFETLKDFYDKAQALNVTFDYPKTYDEDYKKAVDTYCNKNYLTGANLVHEKKYNEALDYFSKVKKYNSNYKNLQQLNIVAACEPLYQKAILNLENKNYSNALINLYDIKLKTDNYKDATDLYELALAQQTKNFILFEPKPNSDRSAKEIEDYLFNNFGQISLNYSKTLQPINSSPFQNANSNVDLYNSANLDLLQAIRKASGADFYYVFDISNKKEYSSGLNKSYGKAFREVKRRINDTTVITEYKLVEYNFVKSQRAFSYDFKYKIINANTGQIVGTQMQNIQSQDAIEYQEFLKPFDGNVNQLYPYNPQITAAAMQYNPRAWRNLFTARNNLKSIDELKIEAYNQNLNLFKSSLQAMK